MPANLYEMIATRNSALAKFFDENHNFAAMVKKLIGLIARMATEDKFDASKLTFEVYTPKGGDVIIIRLKKA